MRIRKVPDKDLTTIQLTHLSRQIATKDEMGSRCEFWILHQSLGRDTPDWELIFKMTANLLESLRQAGAKDFQLTVTPKPETGQTKVLVDWSPMFPVIVLDSMEWWT